MASEAPAPTPEELALLERVATRVVELRLELPAILTLETGRPLSVIAGQTMHFFEPFVTAIFPLPEYRRFAGLIERRESVEALIRLIEDKADAAQRERRQRKDAERAARKTSAGAS
jgi:hypothetical protein